jgi:V8-like Glu-specific endopeptidase
MTSVLAGLIVIGGAALGPGSAARAEDGRDAVGYTEKRIATDVPTGTTSRSARTESDRKPPHAAPATRTSFPLGATGPAFQEPGAGGSVVGGTLANAVDHPYIVGLISIYWEDDGAGGLEAWESTCTGTILSPTKILTAAHCTYDLPLGTTYAIAGRNDLSDDDSGGFVATVASTWIHPSYGYYSDVPRYDVAVLTLKQTLPNPYTPIDLIPQGATTGQGTADPAMILGYGVTGANNADSGLLRTAPVPIQADASCTTSLGSKFDAATTVCAGDIGVDTCGGDSGGPLLIDDNGTPAQVGVTSWGPVSCGASYGAYAQVNVFNTPITADLARSDPNNLDWTGDGHSDLIARTPAGKLYLYYGTGLVRQPTMPAFGAIVTEIGTGWAGFTKVFRVKNWNGDGNESIMARNIKGELLQYKSDGAGNFTGGGTLIGSGWNAFNDMVVTSNWTGNGRPNLLGRAPNGDLYLYTSNGSGGWMNNGAGIKIGNGWNTFDTILTPGTWLGDGKQSLIGRTPAGQLRLYQSNGLGGWVNGAGVQIGTGWNVFTRFMSPGDLNGDNQVDMIGVTAAGALYLYPSDGHGNWMNGGLGIVIGSGWNGFTAIF